MADCPLANRLDTLRKMAAEARQQATRATSAEMRQEYQSLAESWDELLAEIVTASETGKRG
jgi:hypothetical protein